MHTLYSCHLLRSHKTFHWWRAVMLVDKDIFSKCTWDRSITGGNYSSCPHDSVQLATPSSWGVSLSFWTRIGKLASRENDKLVPPLLCLSSSDCNCRHFTGSLRISKFPKSLKLPLDGKRALSLHAEYLWFWYVVVTEFVIRQFAVGFMLNFELRA
jgi:hypothetical protein